MSFKAKVGTTWKNGRRLFAKVGTVWKPVKKAFVKVNGVWKLFYQLIIPIDVYALGYNQVVYSASGVLINGVQALGSNRSYNVVMFTANSTIQSGQSFDLNGNAGGAAPAMASVLNSMAVGQVFAVYSYDEPSVGHDSSDVVAAMQRVGATGIYSGYMTYRGAYLLIGKVGSAPILEQFVGGDYGPGSGDPNAAIRGRFAIVNGSPILI